MSEKGVDRNDFTNEKPTAEIVGAGDFMNEKFSLALINEAGDVLRLGEPARHAESKIETAIADALAEIRRRHNRLPNDETRIAEKFRFARRLENYLEETKKDVD